MPSTACTPPPSVPTKSTPAFRERHDRRAGLRRLAEAERVPGRGPEPPLSAAQHRVDDAALVDGVDRVRAHGRGHDAGRARWIAHLTWPAPRGVTLMLWTVGVGVPAKTRTARASSDLFTPSGRPMCGRSGFCADQVDHGGDAAQVELPAGHCDQMVKSRTAAAALIPAYKDVVRLWCRHAPMKLDLSRDSVSVAAATCCSPGRFPSSSSTERIVA